MSKNIHQRQVEGLGVSLSFLEKKLAETGGEKEKKYLAEVIADDQKKILAASTENARKELNDLFDTQSLREEDSEAGEENDRDDRFFHCRSKDDANDLVKGIAAQYEKLGFSCKILPSEDGKSIKVEVQMPKGFEGKDPLKMSEEELEKVKSVKENENKPGTSPKPLNGLAMGVNKNVEVFQGL
jgi:hypothetical protein